VWSLSPVIGATCVQGSSEAHAAAGFVCGWQLRIGSRDRIAAGMLTTRTVIAALAVLCGVYALAIALTDGVVLRWGPVYLSARSAVRPAVVSAVLALAYGWLSGRALMVADVRRVIGHITPARVASLLALASTGIALAWNTWAIGGSDAYAYGTQADAWLSGELLTPVPMAGEAPWPNTLVTLTPLGMRPRHDLMAIASITASGLSWIMASMKGLLGHWAAFIVAPLATGVLVWCTFVIGRRVSTPGIGLGAAWLVATSPTVLSLGKSVMSDVPAAAAWAAAMAGMLAGTPRTVAGAGVAAGVAITIRPNLAPLVVVLLAWGLWCDLRARRPAVQRLVLCAAPAAVGVVAVALVNQSVNGSPVESGYGDLGQLFSLAHLPVNLRRYGAWMIETQTPLVLAGLVALCVSVRRVWRSGATGPSGAQLLGGMTLAVIAAYAAYTPFDAWWFLRFLLPAWPAILVATVIAVFSVTSVVRQGRPEAALSVGLIGVYTASAAVRLGVFPAGEGERRYATLAQLVAGVTPPGSVVIAGPHVGEVRYYGGRLSLRFDQLDPAWLDRTVAWLHEQQRPVFLLLEDSELPVFRERFGAQSPLGQLTLVPVLAYRAPHVEGTALLFDPSKPDGPTLRVPGVSDPRPRCPLPAPAPSFTVRPTEGPS
jgi:hypothetical protein